MGWEECGVANAHTSQQDQGFPSNEPTSKNQPQTSPLDAFQSSNPRAFPSAVPEDVSQPLVHELWEVHGGIKEDKYPIFKPYKLSVFEQFPFKAKCGCDVCVLVTSVG